MRADYGIGWTLSGLELSGTDEAGVQWLVMDVVGWDDPPEARGSVHPNDYADGGWVEPTFLEPPSLVLQHRIIAGTVEEAVLAMNALKSAIPVRALAPLVQFENGVLKHRMVKQEGKPSFKRLGEVIDASVQLVAPDTRVFSGDGSAAFTYSDVTALPVITGGLQVGSTVPFQVGATAPFRIGATAASGSVTVTNAGDARPPVVVLLTNVVNPSIVADDGQIMNFAITVGTGQTLEVDLDARTVKLNGVNRRHVLTGGWIVPRSGMELKFNATTYNANARMTVRWSDSWE